MKKTFVLFGMLAALAACGSGAESGTEAEAATEMSEPITEEEKTELKEAQDANVELEKLDGEVDSLLNTL